MRGDVERQIAKLPGTDENWLPLWAACIQRSSLFESLTQMGFKNLGPSVLDVEICPLTAYISIKTNLPNSWGVLFQCMRSRLEKEGVICDYSKHPYLSDLPKKLELHLHPFRRDTLDQYRDLTEAIGRDLLKTDLIPKLELLKKTLGSRLELEFASLVASGAFDVVGLVGTPLASDWTFISAERLGSIEVTDWGKGVAVDPTGTHIFNLHVMLSNEDELEQHGAPSTLALESGKRRPSPQQVGFYNYVQTNYPHGIAASLSNDSLAEHYKAWVKSLPENERLGFSDTISDTSVRKYRRDRG